MYLRSFIVAFLTGLLHNATNATGEASISFVDGRWSGATETGSDSKGLEECWASTVFGDGTVFTLAKRNDGSWYLKLSNPGWRLSPSHRYVMDALVDFYPQLHIAAEAKSQTSLEIANLDRISLLELIENGHTIDFSSESFNEKYDLEGSAKIIERIRNCFAD